MIIMPSTNTGADIRAVAQDFPQHLAHLIGPEDGGWRTPFLPYALDNGAYRAWETGERWKQREYLGLCEKAVKHATPPLWLLVPDVVADRDQTLWSWEAWHRDLARWYGWPLGFAVQDGMTTADVPQEAAIIFVGGSRGWKRRTFRQWAKEFPRVHVGKINTYGWLWACAESGVESLDGTGWYYRNDQQLYGLIRFLEEWRAGHRSRPHGPLFEQPEEGAA